MGHKDGIIGRVGGVVTTWTAEEMGTAGARAALAGATALRGWLPSVTDFSVMPWYVPVVSILNPSVSVEETRNTHTHNGTGNYSSMVKVTDQVCKCAVVTHYLEVMVITSSKVAFPTTSVQQGY